MTVTRVEESIRGVPVESLVPGITSDHLDTNDGWVKPFFSTSGKLFLSIHAFVIQSQGRTIVVDTCVGTEPQRPLPGDEEFPDRLSRAVPGGLSAVDVVLCTHLHFDHVGWNTMVRNGTRVPTFPNARYLVSRQELAAPHDNNHDSVWTHPRPRLGPDRVTGPKGFDHRRHRPQSLAVLLS